MIFLPVFLRSAERTWFVDTLFEAMLWLAGSFFLAWKLEHFFALSEGVAKIILLVFLLFYFLYAYAATLKFGMTLLPRFIGKVILVPTDGSPLNANHVHRFLFSLVCENLFIVFTGGIGFLFLIYGRRKHGSTWHFRKSNTGIFWVSGYGGSVFMNRNTPLPRSSLGKWIRKTFPPKG